MSTSSILVSVPFPLKTSVERGIFCWAARRRLSSHGTREVRIVELIAKLCIPRSRKEPIGTNFP